MRAASEKTTRDLGRFVATYAPRDRGGFLIELEDRRTGLRFIRRNNFSLKAEVYGPDGMWIEDVEFKSFDTNAAGFRSQVEAYLAKPID